MSAVYNLRGVKRQVLADILHAEIDRRGGANQRIGQGDGGVYAAGLAEEIAASGQMTPDTAKRRLYAILSGGWYTAHNGTRIQQQLVNFDTADKILSALHLNELWHTNQELADSIVEPPEKKQPEHLAAIRYKKRRALPCKGCGGSWDEFKSDCRTCQSRRCWRLKRERDESAALVQSLDGPRHGSKRTGRVSAGGGTTSIEREAA